MSTDIQRLRWLLSAATPTPWHSDHEVHPDDVSIWAGDQFLANIGRTSARPVCVVFDIEAKNGQLVAESVNALSDLLDEIARLRAIIARQREKLMAWKTRADEYDVGMATMIGIIVDELLNERDEGEHG